MTNNKALQPTSLRALRNARERQVRRHRDDSSYERHTFSEALHTGCDCLLGRTQ